MSDEFLVEDLNLAAALLSEKVDLRTLAVHNFTFIPEFTQPFHYLNELAFQGVIQERMKNSSQINL